MKSANLTALCPFDPFLGPDIFDPVLGSLFLIVFSILFIEVYLNSEE